MKKLLFTFSALIATTSCNIKNRFRADSREKKPMNIIYIMSDDHSYQTISAYDKRFIQTPNIDRLANEGYVSPIALLPIPSVDLVEPVY